MAKKVSGNTSKEIPKEIDSIAPSDKSPFVYEIHFNDILYCKWVNSLFGLFVRSAKKILGNYVYSEEGETES